jgi:hypothetical protein
MHPWMLEQLANEHRRDLLAPSALRRPRRPRLGRAAQRSPSPATGPVPAAAPVQARPARFA